MPPPRIRPGDDCKPQPGRSPFDGGGATRSRRFIAANQDLQSKVASDICGLSLPSKSSLDLLQNRPTVRAITEPQDREEHCLFERAEVIGHLCLHCSNDEPSVKQLVRAMVNAFLDSEPTNRDRITSE